MHNLASVIVFVELSGRSYLDSQGSPRARAKLPPRGSTRGSSFLLPREEGFGSNDSGCSHPHRIVVGAGLSRGNLWPPRHEALLCHKSRHSSHPPRDGVDIRQKLGFSCKQWRSVAGIDCHLFHSQLVSNVVPIYCHRGTSSPIASITIAQPFRRLVPCNATVVAG